MFDAGRASAYIAVLNALGHANRTGGKGWTCIGQTDDGDVFIKTSLLDKGLLDK